MAWALQFDGVNDYAEPASTVTLTGDFDINFKFKSGATIPSTMAIVETNVGSNGWLGRWNGNFLFYWGGVIHGDRPVFSADTEYTVRLWRVGSTCQYTINSTTYTAFTNSKNLVITRFSDTGGLRFSGYIEYFTINGLHDWDSDASDHSNTGIQPVWVDTIGGNNVTGVNMSTDGSAWIDLGGGGIELTAGFTINSAFISQILSDINTNSNQNNTNNFANISNGLISLSGNQSQNNGFDNTNSTEVNNTSNFNNTNVSVSDISSNVGITSTQQTNDSFNSNTTVEVNSTGGFNINNSLSGLKGTVIVTSSNQSNNNDFDALLNVVTSGDLTLEANFGVNNGFSSTISSDITSTSDYNVDNELTSATTSVVASSGNFNQDNNLSSDIDNLLGVLGDQSLSTDSSGSINNNISSTNNFSIDIDSNSIVNTEIGVNSDQEIELGVGSLIQLEISSNSDYTINTSFTATLFVGDFNPILADTINFSYIESNLNMAYIESSFSMENVITTISLE